LFRIAVLLIDGLKLRKTIKYQEQADRFGGYEDLGPVMGRSSRVATEAVVTMLRGIVRRWKNV